MARLARNAIRASLELVRSRSILFAEQANHWTAWRVARRRRGDES